MEDKSLSQYYRWNVPEVMSADTIEAVSIQLRHCNGIVIDISNFKRLDFIAECRLLALLVTIRHLSKRAIIRIQTLPPFDLKLNIWKMLITSNMGLILARMAASIVDYDNNEYIIEVQRRQSAHLKNKNGYLNGVSNFENIQTTAFSAAIVDAFGRPPTSILCNEREAVSFASNFRECLSDYLKISLDDELLIDRINDYIFEAFQNTHDHATKDINGLPIHGLRFISIRKHKLDLNFIDSLIAQKTHRATFSQIDPISSYLSSLQDLMVKSGKTVDFLIEISVADSGYGIPARMRKIESSETLSIDEEKLLLNMALRPGGSSKDKSVVGAGLGLTKIMGAAYALKGLVLFRTGQLNMYRHYLDDGIHWTKFYSRTNIDLEVLRLREWDETPSGYLAGTCVSLIIPWNEPNKNNLEPKQLTLSI